MGNIISRLTGSANSAAPPQAAPTQHPQQDPAAANATPRDRTLAATQAVLVALQDGESVELDSDQLAFVLRGLHQMTMLQPNDPTATHIGTFRLLQLPAELRNEIFRHMIQMQHVIHIARFGPFIPSTEYPAFLNIEEGHPGWQQAVADARSLFFGHNIFRVPNMTAAINFLNSLTPRDRQSVRSIQITRVYAAIRRGPNQGEIARAVGVNRDVVFMADGVSYTNCP